MMTDIYTVFKQNRSLWLSGITYQSCFNINKYQFSTGFYRLANSKA